ncbi:TBC1 domain family member 22A [Gaeumannomyces tritici R3-111a-1]|uniref:TBC1 domain family member 22A n=1 Tax=Gaeumannomyces tritici (strain R3-111a-1) TaxID=644352 RepID=J3NXW8_GAET3|nr:TBC1 domain family member 22A [Gaeumannomyces tritici R3-111a-1]EJT76201.1 TBC1 domain family member 22A [Gaeumannomyces tritici R3-111a-1]
MFSSSGSSKKAPPQEMVQVERTESASPFWRQPQRSPSKSGRDGAKVIGAAYSHADMLKLESLNVSGSRSASSSSPRPHSPPSATAKAPKPIVTSPGSRPPSGLGSPPIKSYVNFLSRTNEDWKMDEGDDMYDDYADDDGDDFGLPSLSNMKRKNRRAAAAQAKDEAHTGSSGGGLGIQFEDTGDIAIERPALGYPMPKKSEGKILRPQYKDILRDPANALHLISHPPTPPNATPKELDAASSRITRINKFKKLLQASTIQLPDLRELAWSGVPEEVRAMTWQLLLSYLPASSERRVTTLERKRKEYLDGVRQAFDRGGSSSGGNDEGGSKGQAATPAVAPATPGRGGRGLDEAIWHQISIDVPRTNPHIELYGYEATQRSLERILYVWAVRHPASGYVQGINDLVTPFWQVFLGTYITDPDIESGMDPGQLPRAVLDAVEADTFWCLTKLLDGIQDHYIVAQPGIQRQVTALRDLTARIDKQLAKHLEAENVEFIQFSFRWMNCLLMREISVKNTIRMWDTYMAEENGFSEFHLYVCAAFLVKWSAKLINMDFQEIMMFLQSLPTRGWTEKDIELLLSEAFIWASLYKGSSAHLRGPSSGRAPSASFQL